MLIYIGICGAFRFSRPLRPLQVSLQFLVGFSSFNGCKRVDRLPIFSSGSVHFANSVLVLKTCHSRKVQNEVRPTWQYDEEA